MKIEKVNDNQIRCTLTREDLEHRQLKLSELAYGTEKAKSLFRDMMQQASYEFGFEAEDIPLMIEAIPLSTDTIILIITKVEYPEELDTRFSKFSESDSEADGFDDRFGSDLEPAPEGADDILDLFRRIQQDKSNVTDDLQKAADFVPLDETLLSKQTAPKKQPVITEDTVVNMTKLYVFDCLDDVNRLAHVVKGFYTEENSLYKCPSSGKYYLIINKGSHRPEDFNKLCNILSEYASQIAFTPSSESYFSEHYETLISGRALQVLADL